MRIRTKKKLLSLLDIFQRKVQRAKEAGRRQAFAELAQHVALIVHVMEEEIEPQERSAYQGPLSKVGQVLQALPLAMDARACQMAGMRLGELCARLMAQVQQAQVRKLIVFLPYKASMWDSLESIWMAADHDRAHCRTLVVPIPYADRNADGTPKQWNYEIDRFPKYVPVVHHESVDLEALHPDAIFVHNPYDNYNTVTSVDMKYYSSNLKKWTDCLVYVPYYVTSGGMGEFQRYLPPYDNFDYIIAQGEAGLPYYAPEVQEKLLPLGSPKLDKVVHLCENPPEPPEEWKAQLAGRTVYFYNTSLSGFLADTTRFLQKMRYVFETFRGRDDACLLWRPHPLLDATLHTMRPGYVREFEELRDMFLRDKIGIYDTTPEIEPTIALSDVYLGDAGTSVTALFGAAGKPLFLFNNRLHDLPRPDGWITSVLGVFPQEEVERWLVTPANQLWGRGADGTFHFAAQLSRYTSGGYFAWAYERLGKVFACPANAQEVIVFDHGEVRQIQLPDGAMPYGGRFAMALADDRYLFLLPNRYPHLLRIDLQTEQIVQIDGVQQRYSAKTREGDWFVGGSLLKDGLLYLTSPFTEEVLVFAEDTLEHQSLTIGQNTGGANIIAPDGDNLYLLPLAGTKVRRWNPMTGALRVYDAAVEGLSCFHPGLNAPCGGQAFSSAAFTDDKIILAPNWGNMFVAIDKETGVAEPWAPPAPLAENEPDDYFFTGGHGIFSRHIGGTVYHYMNLNTRKLWRVDVATKACSEVPLIFDPAEVRAHAKGFQRLSEWVQYGCEEDALHTLPALLDGTLPGTPYDAAAERAAYGESAANVGTCGEKVYAWLAQHLDAAEQQRE